MASKSAASGATDVASRAASVWTLFGCDGRVFGFALERVREIVLPRPFTRLPGCGPAVCGLIGLRGRIVTVFDLGAALGLRAAAARPDHRLLLIDCNDRLVAGAVEQVAAVRSASLKKVTRRNALVRDLDVDRAAVVGLGEADGERFVALDSDRILGDLLI